MATGVSQATPYGYGGQELKSHQWEESKASLRSTGPFPLKKIVLCDMPSHCYVIGTDVAKSERRLLCFSKSNSETLMCDNYETCTAAEIDAHIARIYRDVSTHVLRAKALLGCIRFTKGYYLLVATRRRQVARLGFHRIFEVVDIELVSLCVPGSTSFSSFSSYGVASTAIGTVSSPFLQHRNAEDYYRSQLLTSSLKQHFYYSHTYDLTNTLQANMTVPCSGRKMRSKFVWNEFLVEPFFAPFLSQSAPPVGSESMMIPAGFDQWTVYLAHGSIVQCPVWCSSKLILITLIGRASKNFAGARYLRRGVNSDGHVANHVEVEQIVVDESTLHTHFTAGAFSSYVQVRGSVPLHWFHPPTQLPKPPIKLGVTDLYYSHTRKHFQELLKDYGAPLIVLNLLRQREKRARESILSQYYRKAVATLKGFVHEEQKRERVAGNAEEMPEVLLYHELDIREMAHNAWNNSTALAEQALEKTGFFVCNSSGTRVQRQVGVVRSNCLDCVDRTNLAQFFFGLHVLGHQLHALSLLHSPVDLALSPGVQDCLLRMYLLMGDAIAVQYGGSPQVGAGVLNRGTGWDKIMGIKRLYNNITGDREKQSVLNLFLGRYQPYPNTYSTAHNPVMRIPDAESSGGNSSSSFIAATGNEHTSAKEKELMRSGQDGRVGRVVELSEIESDYYLQVKGAPSLHKPEEAVGWWKEPLRRFRQSMGLHRCQASEKEKGLFHPLVLPSQLPSSPRQNTRNEIERDEKRNEEKVIRSMCISERASVIKYDVGSKTDDVKSSGGGTVLHDVEVCLLQSTTASNTLVARRREIVRRRPLILNVPDLRQGIMNHSETHSDCVRYNTTMESVELIHDHRTYPDDVKRSIFYHTIEAVRQMADQCEPPEDLQRMQLTILTKFGDPFEWNTETVVEALVEVEPEVSPGTLSYLRHMKVDGYTLLNRLNTKSMAEKLVVDRFIGIVHRLPQASLEWARQCLVRLDATTSSLHILKECRAQYNSGGSIAFPDATCALLQPFFREAIYSTTLGGIVRQLLREMTDKVRGVPCSDRLRYREKTNQGVPPAAVASQCFSANKLHWWLLRESQRLGLTLHEHVERNEGSPAAWRFMLWLAHASLITLVIMEPAFGVIVQPTIKRDAFASLINLFTLHPLQEMHILNRRICSGGLDPVSEVTIPSSTLTSAVTVNTYAESLVSLALSVLSSVQEMSMTPGGETIYDSAFRMLLDSVFMLSVHLEELHLLSLRGRERWCFWVNIFNALYIHAWLAAPGKRAQDYTSFYYTNGYEIGGYFFSLNDIKNGILRGNKPAPFALLPPFEEDDPRLALVLVGDEATVAGNCNCEEGGSLMIHRLRERILLALIDMYLVPDNFEDASAYNPRALFNEEESMCLDSTLRGGVVPIAALDVNDSEEEDSNNNTTTIGMGDDDIMRERFVSASRVLRRASSIPVGAASWFASWFGNRHASRSTAFTHPCVPLVVASLPQQLYGIESFMLQSLGSPEQPMVTRNGVQLPRSILPLLLYPEELGATPDEILRTLHQSHLTAAEQAR